MNTEKNCPKSNKLFKTKETPLKKTFPGIFNAFSAITGFVGVYLAGRILQATGNNWAWVFAFTAAQCLLGAVVYALRGTGNKII
jgi:hypothetical protein